MHQAASISLYVSHEVPLVADGRTGTRTEAEKSSTQV